MLLQNLRLFLWAGCTIAAIWTLWSSTRTPKTGPRWRRSYLGLIGLTVGWVSAALLAWFYAHVYLYHSLVAHGLNLWEYVLTATVLSVIGGGLAALSVGDHRLSGLLTSVPTFFEWGHELIAGKDLRRINDLLMFVAIGLLFSWLFWRNRAPIVEPKSWPIR